MFAEPDDGFKPAWHDAALAEDRRWAPAQMDDDVRCGICNARPGQPHLATGRYP